jgi:thioredoxin reductase
MRSYRYPSYLEKAAIEFQSSEFGVGCYIRTNLRGETNIKGIYAAGDEVFGTISHAAVFGRSAGRNAAGRRTRYYQEGLVIFLA